MLRYFLPLMAPSSRFLVVASSFGTLLHLHKPLWSKFDVAVSPLSLDDIDAAEQVSVNMTLMSAPCTPFLFKLTEVWPFVRDH